jgi:hypothetical protein
VKDATGILLLAEMAIAEVPRTGDELGGWRGDSLFEQDGDVAVNSKDGVSGNDSLDGGADTDTKTTDAIEKSIVGFPQADRREESANGPRAEAATLRPPFPCLFTEALSSTLAIWPCNTPHRLGALRRPLRLVFACRCGRRTRKNKAPCKVNP